MNNEILVEFKKVFNENADFLINTGGRLEICGNHTDHNHGLCIVANCSLRVYAAIKKNLSKVRIQSKGYKYFEFDINDLSLKESECSTTLALCKGILFKLANDGYKIGGFDAYIESEIPDGSGVSSSAAIESLFGYIISYLYNDGKISELVIAKTGQYSENTYFHKPCGLLDQVGTSFNSSNFIDFKNIDNPLIKTMEFNLPAAIYLIKSEGNHSNLTPLYKAITDNMRIVANKLGGKMFLRDVESKDIFKDIDALDCSLEVKNCAKHFFIENNNVLQAKEAILNNDLDLFFDALRKSQETSKNNIKNTFVEGEYKDSPQNIIDDLTPFIKENGAIRIHGGGFKGTVLAIIKDSFKDQFEEYIYNKYDPSRIFKVYIPKKALSFQKIN